MGQDGELLTDMLNDALAMDPCQLMSATELSDHSFFAPVAPRCLAHLEQRLLAPPPMSVAERAKTVVAEVAELQDDVYSAAATCYRPPTFDEMYLHHHLEVMRVPMLLAHIA